MHLSPGIYAYTSSWLIPVHSMFHKVSYKVTIGSPWWLPGDGDWSVCVLLITQFRYWSRCYWDEGRQRNAVITKLLRWQKLVYIIFKWQTFCGLSYPQNLNPKKGYIGETGRILEKRLSEHRGAVKRNDLKNGIAVHTWKTQHKLDWEAATVKQVETNYTRQKIIEAIHIKKQKVTFNLDCGRSLNSVWQPLLCSP